MMNRIRNFVDKGSGNVKICIIIRVSIALRVSTTDGRINANFFYYVWRYVKMSRRTGPSGFRVHYKLASSWNLKSYVRRRRVDIQNTKYVHDAVLICWLKGLEVRPYDWVIKFDDDDDDEEGPFRQSSFRILFTTTLLPLCICLAPFSFVSFWNNFEEADRKCNFSKRISEASSMSKYGNRPIRYLIHYFSIPVPKKC